MGAVIAGEFAVWYSSEILVTPVVIPVFVHKFLEDGFNSGRCVVEVEDGSVVPEVPQGTDEQDWAAPS